ncbi:hypothetical protein ABZ454_04795 [Streptomyces sp. NPDC005803]|uniref:hypothetical protein n=1 Tax=Streptomyces sp. NPDC005803 TaxID=3154297 RepID=UPI0033FE2B22
MTAELHPGPDPGQVHEVAQAPVQCATENRSKDSESTVPDMKVHSVCVRVDSRKASAGRSASRTAR